jgi:hypothetical protein
MEILRVKPIAPAQVAVILSGVEGSRGTAFEVSSRVSSTSLGMTNWPEEQLFVMSEFVIPSSFISAPKPAGSRRRLS